MFFANRRRGKRKLKLNFKRIQIVVLDICLQKFTYNVSISKTNCYTIDILNETLCGFFIY
jgi:hypothetical protein